MQCPYCLSEVAEEAFVCKVCTRDLYLFKPMMAKVAELEKQLEETPNQQAYEERITKLEGLLQESESAVPSRRGFREIFFDTIIFIFIPLLLLLTAHALITVVFDTKMVYLRIISICLPLPFGYFLFKRVHHNIFPWFLAILFLAIASVIGMSGITSLVDKSPIWPQNLFEWRESLAYSASIAFSFLTGMLIGKITYTSKKSKSAAENPWVMAVVAALGEDKLSPAALKHLVKNLHKYAGIAFAAVSTSVSVYTGLKDFL